MAPENYVTYRELTQSQDKVKKEVIEHVDKLELKFNAINEQVVHLKDLVIPLTISMGQTAENTKEMSNSLKEFTKNQSATNSIFNEKLNTQAIAIESVKNVTNSITERKKYNAGVIVAIIGLIGTFVASLFQLAPYIFG